MSWIRVPTNFLDLNNANLQKFKRPNQPLQIYNGIGQDEDYVLFKVQYGIEYYYVIVNKNKIFRDNKIYVDQPVILNGKNIQYIGSHAFNSATENSRVYYQSSDKTYTIINDYLYIGDFYGYANCYGQTMYDIDLQQYVQGDIYYNIKSNGAFNWPNPNDIFSTGGTFTCNFAYNNSPHSSQTITISFEDDFFDFANLTINGMYNNRTNTSQRKVGLQKYTTTINGETYNFIQSVNLDETEHYIYKYDENNVIRFNEDKQCYVYGEVGSNAGWWQGERPNISDNVQFTYYIDEQTIDTTKNFILNFDSIIFDGEIMQGYYIADVLHIM